MLRTQCSRLTRVWRVIPAIVGVALWCGGLQAQEREPAGERAAAGPEHGDGAARPAPADAAGAAREAARNPAAAAAGDPPAASEAPPSAEPLPDPAAALAPELTPPATAPAAVDPGIQKVQQQLAAAIEERERESRLLPWLTVGLGAGAVLAASATGAGYALSCEASCESPNWITLTVVAGATLATLGAIWVVHKNAELRVLDSRRYQLEQELLRLRLAQPAHAAAGSGGRAAFSLRFSF